jgi:hypothetical protein
MIEGVLSTFLHRYAGHSTILYEFVTSRQRMPHGAACPQIETAGTGGRKRRPAIKCTVTVTLVGGGLWRSRFNECVLMLGIADDQRLNVMIIPRSRAFALFPGVDSDD